MDLSSLMGGIRPLKTTDYRRKIEALRSAHFALGDNMDMEFSAFVAATPDLITGSSLGAPAEDFYLTTILAAALHEAPDIDAVAAAVLHHVTLQLNFMTRFISNPHGPECIVLDGDPRLFPVVMANGNVVGGIQIGPSLPEIPSWMVESNAVTLTRSRHSHATSVDAIVSALEAINSRRIGCVYIEVEPEAKIDIARDYAALASHVADDTFYVLCGEAAVMLDTAIRLESAYPSATILTRAYDVKAGAFTVRRAILVASGVPTLPSLTIESLNQPYYDMVDKTESARVSTPPYRNGGEGGQHEMVKIKRAVAIRSSAPLPEEARRRISDDQFFPHECSIIQGGTMVPWQTFNCNTFLHIADSGELISGVGEGNVFFSPELIPTEDGKLRCTLPPVDTIHVRGAAMPLTFATGLHTFFSHFLLQCFPRVRILRDLKVDATVIVDHDIRPKQIEMLNRVGIGPDRILRRPKGAAVHADELIVPRPWPLVFSPYTLEIYDELIASAAPSTQPKGRRILISREYRSTWRTMLTYPAVAAMLRDRYKFEEIRPELLSLDEEINLYRDARVVIGAEGAGLYSAVYAGEGSTYVSIGDEDYIMPVLGSAASVRGFDVAYVFGESLRATSDVRRRLENGHADYMVDPLAVAGLLDEIL